MKKYQILMIIFAMLLIQNTLAEQVAIFNLQYDNGIITVKDQVVQEGFYPDRLLQPNEGYSCSITNSVQKKLYDFKFDIPLNLYTDSISNRTIFGGIIITNKTDFSFITPYYRESKEIACLNPRGYEIIREPIIHPALSPDNKSWIIVYASLAFVGLFIILIYLRKRSSR